MTVRTLSGSADAGRTASAVSATSSGTGLFTGDRLHEVVLGLDDAAFRQALSTFQQSAEKTWLEVPVTLDGPGNNSYLWWDRDADRMTVLCWDHNLTFGVSNRLGAGGGGAPPAGAPAGGGAPVGAGGPVGGGRGPGGLAANPLVTRFEAVGDLKALEAAATTR